MKRIFTPILCLLMSAICYHASAQHVLYTQNFEGSSVLPSGWYATANSWYNDTTLGNASLGYKGASGLYNLVIKDTTATAGPDSLITEGISTIGYNTITVEWGARFSKHFADSGSTVALYWSIDGTTWANMSYAENPNNSNWLLENDSTPIVLPSGAANQAALKLMWVANIKFTPSGTYRIDDLTVAGTAITGINDISTNSFAHIFADANSDIHIDLNETMTGTVNVELYDLSGRLIAKDQMTTASLIIDASSFSKGMYVVKLSEAGKSTIGKVAVK